MPTADAVAIEESWQTNMIKNYERNKLLLRQDEREILSQNRKRKHILGEVMKTR